MRHLLAFLGAHHILHVSRVRVKIWQQQGGTLHEDIRTFMTIPSWIIFRNEKYFRQKNCGQNQNTHFLFSNVPSTPTLRKSCRLWHVAKHGRAGQATDDNITGRIRSVCYLTKATNTHSEYAIFLAFPRQQWLTRTRLCCDVCTVTLCPCGQTDRQTQRS
jgi:hypothetical protein